MLARDFDHGVNAATGLIDFIDGEQSVAAIGKNLARFDSEEERIGFAHGCAISTTHATRERFFLNNDGKERRKQSYRSQYRILAFGNFRGC